MKNSRKVFCDQIRLERIFIKIGTDRYNSNLVYNQRELRLKLKSLP